MSKKAILAGTLKGYNRLIFCPTEDMYNKLSKDIDKSYHWFFLSSRSLNDTQFFIRKFEERLNELKRSIKAYDDFMDLAGVDSESRKVIGDALLDAIHSGISVVLGMVRRSEKKGYDLGDLVDVTRTTIDNFCERSDY